MTCDSAYRLQSYAWSRLNVVSVLIAHTGLFLVHIAAAVNFLFGYVQQTKLTTLHVGFWAHVGFRYRSNFLS